MEKLSIAENKTLNAQEFLDKKLILESYPYRAYFALTGKCNLLCEHCPAIRRAEDNIDVSETVYDTFCRDILPSLEEVTLGANNYGEQLLSKRFEDFLDKASNCGTKVRLWTNGVLFNQDKVDAIIKANANVTISVEGAGENYHRIRHVPFEKIEKTLSLLLNARYQAKGKSRIHLAFTAFKGNLDDLYTLLDLGIDHIGINFLQPKNDYWKQFMFSPMEIGQLEYSFFSDFDKRAVEKGVVIERKKIQQNNIQRRICPDPWQTINVRETGDCLPCCVAGDVLIIGNIGNDDFRKIWNGKRIKKLRYRTIQGHPMATCKVCMGIINPKGYSFVDNIVKYMKTTLIRFELYGALNTLMHIRRKFKNF